MSEIRVPPEQRFDAETCGKAAPAGTPLEEACVCGLAGWQDGGEEVAPGWPREAFPLRICATPVGIFLEASFACPVVRHNLGTPLEGQSGLLKARFPLAMRNQIEGREDVPLLPGVRVPWSALQPVLLDLDAIARSVVPDAAGLSVGAMLVTLDRFTTQLQLLAERQIPEGRKPRGVEELLAKASASLPWKNPRLQGESRRLLLATFSRMTLAAQANDKQPGTVRGAKSFWGQVFGGGVRLQADGKRVSLRALAEVRSELPADGVALFRRWLRGRLHGCGWFGPPDGYGVISGLRRVGLEAVMMVIAAKVSACTAGRPGIAVEDLHAGLVHVSRGLVHPPNALSNHVEMDAYWLRHATVLRELIAWGCV